MAVQSTLSKLPSRQAVVDNTLLSPFITGPLLLYTRQNPAILDKIPWFPNLTLKLPFSLPFDIPNSLTIRPTPPLKTLKVLFTLGLVLTVNRFLSRLALNYWHLQKQGQPWDFQTEGKETIVLTGGSSGFGKEMVKIFSAQTKAKIVVLDIQDLPADLKDLPRVSYLKVDLSSTQSIEETVSKLLADHTPTVLINNAGIATAHTILHTTDAHVQKLFAINVFSHFTLIRLLLPVMMKNRKGHIVTLASMASYTGCANLGDYCASKAAVLGMHETLTQELAHRYEHMGGHSIQTSIVHPLWAQTPLIGSFEPELKKAGAPVLTAEAVASKVVRQVLDGRSGAVFVPDHMWTGTLMRFTPDWLQLTIRKDLSKATHIIEK